MQPRLEATLADFVPALRFLSPDSVDRHLGHGDLPPAWWTSVPISRAVDAIGAAELPDRLADLAYDELRHLRLGDLLPAAWLARNDFRLSQWPDGVRTNVLVRTPDWADLLTATVQEIGDWTQVGTSTVRPVIAQLFAEVLGLLPAEEIAARSAAFAAVAGAEGAAKSAEDSGAEASADESAESDTGNGQAAAKVPVVRASRGIRISKRNLPAPASEPEPIAEREPEPAEVVPVAPAVPAALDSDGSGSDSVLEPVSDLLEAIEDELRPVSLPPPPTGDLGAVVRWLAEEAPDVPLMSELARVTLETVAVVGIEGAPPEVRTALLRLTSLVPETLLPEGLDVSEDAFSVPGAELQDPYDAPEMTAILGAVRPTGPEAVPAPEERSALPAGPADSADDLTVLAMPTALPGGRAGTDPDGYADPYGVDDAEVAEDTGSPAPPKSVDNFYELPPEADPDARHDADVADEADGSAAEQGHDAAVEAPSYPHGGPADSLDAFGQVPPATREDLAVQVPEPPAQAADSVDAFGEVPPSTRDDIPVHDRSRAPDLEPTMFEPSAADGRDTGPGHRAVPSWIKGGGAKAGSPDDQVTVEVGAAPAAVPDDSSVPGRDPGQDAPKGQNAHEAHEAKESTPDSGAAAAASASGGIVIPPRPTTPPPIPPMPSTPPPGANAPAGAVETPPRGSALPASTLGEPAEDAPRPAPAPGNIVLVLAAWFTGREPRWRTLARDRMFTDSPREISSLAAEFDKDSAEVEALERALRRHLNDQLDQPEGAQVREHLQSVRSSLGAVAKVAELRDLDKRHTVTVPGLGVQLWQVVRGLLDLNTSADGWLTAGAPGELESRTSEIVGAACEHSAAGSVPLGALEPPLSMLGVRPELHNAWVARLPAFQVADGVVRPWPADESGPVETAATVEAVRGGSAPAAEPAEDPASAPEPALPEAAGDPGSAAKCFRDEQGVWWFRIDVDTPLLDGERLRLPAEFVSRIGLRPGQSLRLHHAAGPAALRWEHEPFCVSMRTILAGLGAEDGDMVFVGSMRPGRLETRLLAGDAKLRLPRWARALRHTGVDPVPDQVNLPALLGARLGLEDGCDLKAVLKRLQDRGDADVLELLGVAQAR